MKYKKLTNLRLQKLKYVINDDVERLVWHKGRRKVVPLKTCSLFNARLNDHLAESDPSKRNITVLYECLNQANRLKLPPNINFPI